MTEIMCPDCETKFTIEVNYCKKCRYDFQNKKSYQVAERTEGIGEIICSNCNHKNVGNRFCEMCGSVLDPESMIQCQKCNELNPKEAKFCVRCSESLEQKEKKILCPKCKNENKSPAKFCIKCGTELDAEITFCQHCGSKNHIEAKFCISCGKPVKNKPENCPKCGARITKDMKFCMTCGTKVEV